jgi:hypothetical protein
MLFLSSASAQVTVVSVTGSPSTCASTGGNLGDPTTGIVTAVSWSQTSGYSNVTISAALDDLDGPTLTQFAAYLTTSIGPGTTAAQQIATANVTAPQVGSPTATLTTIFTGLTLPPGTYYLTIYGSVNGPVLGPDCWTFSTGAPTIVTAAGVAGLTDLQVLGVAPYPPASLFHGVSGQDFFQVTGTVIAPPAFSKSFATVDTFTGSTEALTFTIANSNTTVGLTGLAFSDTLPLGFVVATPNAVTGTCGGGTVTATPGGTSISLSGGAVAASSSCTIGVNVLAIAAGAQTNVTSSLTSIQAAAAPAATASTVIFPARDYPFQISYAADPSAGESYVNIINTGANGAPPLGPGLGAATGNTCVNVYAVDPSEELIACCSCLLTPNQVMNLGVNADLTIKTETGVVPPSVTIKLVNTLAGPTGTGTSCTNSATSAGGAGFPLAVGMVAYGTTPQAVGTVFNQVEHPFIPSTLSAAELASLTGRCSSIVGNASGYGICLSCRSGALGATKQ